MNKEKKHEGGRPAKDREKVKSGTLKIHVSDAEMSQLKLKANQWDVTVSQYVCDAALRHKVSKMIITNNSDLALLNKIGVNVNQIARQLNSSRSYRECFGVSPMREGETLTALKVLQSQRRAADGSARGVCPRADGQDFGLRVRADEGFLDARVGR